MRLAIALLIVAGVGLPSSAQDIGTSSSGRTFAVASVRPSPDGVGGLRLTWQPDRLVVASATLSTLILTAYPGEARFDRLEGGPDWLRTVRFDVNAVADPADIATPEQRVRLLRAFLADRFKLAVRRELRTKTVYTLLLAREDGRLGPSLWPSDLACDAPERTERLPLDDGERPACGGGSGLGLLTGGNQTPAAIALSLSLAGVPDVQDRTGLDGTFDFVLRYAPGALATSRPGDVPAPTAYPVIFTALEEQLGLRLEPTRGEVPYFVVDYAEWPSID